MLIAIYLPTIYLNTQIYKKTFILLMNRLVALRIRLLNDPSDLLILHYPTVDVQQYCLCLYRV